MGKDLMVLGLIWIGFEIGKLGLDIEMIGFVGVEG
jgi:hypothetical protein